jgi:hypothetical protein
MQDTDSGQGRFTRNRNARFGERDGKSLIAIFTGCSQYSVVREESPSPNSIEIQTPASSDQSRKWMMYNSYTHGLMDHHRGETEP